MILPECCYLERTEPLPHAAGNHRVIGGLEKPWTVPVWQKVVEPKDGAPSSWQLFAELASRAGKNAEFIATLNGMFRVKDEYSVPMDQKLDVEAFADSILKSNIDEEHDFAWLKEHAVYDHPRTVDEVYIWANGEPGRVPLYFDFLLEAKSKVEAKVRGDAAVPGALIKYVRSRVDNIDEDFEYMIACTDIPAVDDLIKQCKKEFGHSPLHVFKLGAAVASNTGPDTIAITYLGRPRR